MPFKWTFQSRNNYLTGILFTKQFMYHVWLGNYFIVMVREADIYRKVFSDSTTTQRVFTGTMLYHQFVELLWLYNQPEQALTKDVTFWSAIRKTSILCHAQKHLQCSFDVFLTLQYPLRVDKVLWRACKVNLHNDPHAMLCTVILLYLTFSYTNQMLVYWEIYIYTLWICTLGMSKANIHLYYITFVFSTVNLDIRHLIQVLIGTNKHYH